MNDIKIVICPVCLHKFNMAFARPAIDDSKDISVVCPHCQYALIKTVLLETQPELNQQLNNKTKPCKTEQKGVKNE